MDDRTKRVPGRSFVSGDGNSFAESPSEKVQRSLLSSSVVGTANRGLVIQALFDLGPTSRAELARRAGVNRTTISGIVQPLIDDDVLVETEPDPSKRTGGKPARPLWFSPSARPICGVLLMPNAVRSCLVALDGTVIGENRVLLPMGDGPVAPIIRAVKKSVRSALAAATRKPLGVGVAVGAMVDTDEGSIVAMKSCSLTRWLPAGRRAPRRIRSAGASRSSSSRAARRRSLVRQGQGSSAICGDLYGRGVGRGFLFRRPSLPGKSLEQGASWATLSCRSEARSADAAVGAAGTPSRRSAGFVVRPNPPNCQNPVR